MNNYRKCPSITITGETESGLLFSLDEVRRMVAEGYLAGFNSNETEDYEFNVVDCLSEPLAPAQAGNNP